MPEIRMRPKHQVTLPASVVREAKLKPDDRLTVTFINGSIIITPKHDAKDEDDIMSFAGIGHGLWGNTPEEVDQTLCNMKNSWER
ncbi:AbrB/MazE/SpoVT family DNA-binding domain-containing protein [Rhodoferax ferrireducens]|uniref:AbrB/MazE/SpoVT family DNA-binding domain-containing protein n=1 Tax=Rhodoferax ferrireducens TaxID=192843 RepID=UPI003BB7C1D4